MKIVGFETDAGPRLGVIEGEEVVDLQAVDPTVPNDLAAALARHNGDLGPLGDIAARAPAFARRPLAGLRYALPVARPGKIICLGLNYLDHVKEGPNAANVPKFPTLFMRGLNSFVPHLQPLTRPLVSETFDYEAELVAVIGKRAKHMTLENAISCVAGWTCANEGSIREFQRHTTQWHAGKNFDHSGSLGPWVVTADELPPGGKGLKIESRCSRWRRPSSTRPRASRSSPATSSSPARRPASATPASRRPGCATATSARSRSKGSASCAMPSRTRNELSLPTSGRAAER